MHSDIDRQRVAQHVAELHRLRPLTTHRRNPAVPRRRAGGHGAHRALSVRAGLLLIRAGRRLAGPADLSVIRGGVIAGR